LKLLEYRRSDQLNAHTIALREMTAEANLLSRRLEALSEDSRTDTRSMKILTFMASGFLPANLIAVSLIYELSLKFSEF
jgi:hypothetical protein